MLAEIDKDARNILALQQEVMELNRRFTTLSVYVNEVTEEICTLKSQHRKDISKLVDTLDQQVGFKIKEYREGLVLSILSLERENKLLKSDIGSMRETLDNERELIKTEIRKMEETFEKEREMLKSDIGSTREMFDKERELMKTEIRKMKGTFEKEKELLKCDIREYALFTSSNHAMLSDIKKTQYAWHDELKRAISSSTISCQLLMKKKENELKYSSSDNIAHGFFFRRWELWKTADARLSIDEFGYNYKRDYKHITIGTITFPLKQSKSHFEFETEPMWIRCSRGKDIKISLPQNQEFCYDERSITVSFPPKGSTLYEFTMLPPARVRVDISDLFKSYKRQKGYDISEVNQRESATHYFYKRTCSFDCYDEEGNVLSSFCYGWQIEVKKIIIEPVENHVFWKQQPFILIGRIIYVDVYDDGLCGKSEEKHRVICKGIVTAYNPMNEKHTIVQLDDGGHSLLLNLKTVPYSFDRLPYSWIEPTECLMFEEEKK